MALGRNATDPTLECDQVHEDIGKVPAREANKEKETEDLRERAATDAAEGGDDEDHGYGRGKEGGIVSLTPRFYMSLSNDLKGTSCF
jgi:hypothetical protein